MKDNEVQNEKTKKYAIDCRSGAELKLLYTKNRRSKNKNLNKFVNEMPTCGMIFEIMCKHP
jgi:hypothetical protein